MHIEFLGAAREVTGSCHVVTVGGRKLLLECGLIQGGRRDEDRNRDPFPFDPGEIDAVILSHAHLDHSGRLPLLARQGFRGPIYTHHASRELSRIVLKDAAFMNEKDAEWESRRRQRKGLAPRAPLYTQDDAEAAMKQFRGLPYDRESEILTGIRLTLRDAGHILGSAIVTLDLAEAGVGSHSRRGNGCPCTIRDRWIRSAT